MTGGIMSEREQLIAALMNPETSTVVDFEASYKDLFVYGCDRAHASSCADKIIAEGGTRRSLQIMSDEGLRSAQRKLNIEFRERKVAQQQRTHDAEVESRMPIRRDDATEFAIRGGQPGSWFDANESAYDGGVSYRQAGQPQNEDLERRVRSAFAK
jgi:hypothetical protein